MKGIIIDEPWISLILSGQKTWEMRKNANHDRGLVGLIRKGSGHVVGTVILTGSLLAIDPKEYAATEHLHAIKGDRQEWAVAEGYLVPWVLEGARPLPRPVPYSHKLGSQSRVILEEPVARMVRDQVPQSAGPVGVVPLALNAPSPIELPRNAMQLRPGPAPNQDFRHGAVVGEKATVTLTQGNLNNGHINLRSIISFFPEETVGGSDKKQIAKTLLRIHFEGVGTVETDITGPDRLDRPGTSKHCFFRKRTAKKFFKIADAQVGDIAVIERTGPVNYRITLAKGSSV